MDIIVDIWEKNEFINIGLNYIFNGNFFFVFFVMLFDIFWCGDFVLFLFYCVILE